MLIRFGALAALAGLGVGAVLRVALGRRRFALLVVIAHLPLLYHLARVGAAGNRAGLPTSWTAALAGAGLLLMLLGMLVGRASATRRPWLAVVTPGLVAAVYLLLPVLLYNLQLTRSAVNLDSVATYAYVLAAVFMVALLVPFAPPPVTTPRLPRMPWQG